MNLVIQNLVSFFSIVLVAMFVQNAIFTRGLGVSRLVKLVSDSAVDSIIFCALLTLIQVLSAPLAYFANGYLSQTRFWFRGYVRPLVLVLCVTVAFVVVIIAITALRLPNAKDILAVLPMASFNCAVLGPLLLTATYSYTFVQTMGFALGSGLGYGFAVLIVSEGQRKLVSRIIPATFRGLPVNLLYIGILALALYGLIGHRVVI
ncbi:MAG: Rnf-Nqr domain containing protein [Oscillospiraceae bacterium]